MKKEILKDLALKAKNRMIHKNNAKTHEQISGVNIRVISETDDVFENKVRALLADDEDVINPLKYLMDESLLMKLDARAREKYLLETIEKYRETRRRLEKESVYTFSC